ncbi:actin cytoskeleton-regulatory complex protein PAN1-like isoform X2 [Megalobrama amblycephala]|uniref:actin cytoskeleton-regulatory complex protein PAN1-like isoform X2 n=1 Tax=Megalobrama amblycephala TaxID=75352 RepID=UPI002014416E|nr:actin cytoskeleton-regulatory complex protein PAN1-like isoform X2 [Megalobrama amblycephala]
MRFIFFLILLGFICLTSAQDEDCCELFVYRARMSIQERVTSYRIQEFEGPHCFSGVVFKWDFGEFCSDPRLQWVQDLMKRVDGLSEGSSVRRNVRSASRRSERSLEEEQHPKPVRHLMPQHIGNTRAIRVGPIRPKPVKPQPIRPKPIKPQPIRPKPVKPQPIRPKPVKPQPIRPKPIKPQPIRPKPIKPQPIRPKPIKPQPIRPKPVKPIKPSLIRP